MQSAGVGHAFMYFGCKEETEGSIGRRYGLGEGLWAEECLNTDKKETREGKRLI